MNENDNTVMTSIYKAPTLEEIGEFWDAHDLADYWDQWWPANRRPATQHRRPMPHQRRLSDRMCHE